nr:MAG TPA: hypothetical protein [Caudoviricetes sp.]
MLPRTPLVVVIVGGQEYLALGIGMTVPLDYAMKLMCTEHVALALVVLM